MKITIITITFNNIAELINTVNSVIPVIDKIEFIIIDGGSTDGTKQYLQEISKKYNFNFISEPDSGIYDAMNKGIQFSSNEYLLFLNSGDTLQSKNFEKLIEQEKFESDIIVCNIKAVDENGMPGSARSLKTNPSCLKSYPCIPHQSTFIRRELFFILGNYSYQYRYLSDYDFFCNCYKNNYSFSWYQKYTIANFSQTGVSSLPQNSLKLLKELRSIQKKYFGVVSTKQTIIWSIKYVFNFIPNGEKIFKFIKGKST